MSRRRLFSLLATAAMASSLGIVLGSTLRFQVGSVNQASLFNPQQDFPPLEEWPPEVPAVETDKFNTNWDHEIPEHQLLYNDQPYTDFEEVEHNDSNASFYDEEQVIPTETLVPEEVISSTSATLRDDEGTIIDEVPKEDISSSVVSTSHEAFNNTSNEIETPSLNNPPSVTAMPPWFNKQPLSDSKFSDSQFTDGLVIRSPEISIPSSDLASD